jgi:cytochrome P450
MNAMVVQFDEGVFDNDAHEFRPERWLVSKERYQAMEKAMLVYGAGTRICIGRHVSDDLELQHCFGHLIIQYSSRTLRFMRSYQKFFVVSR